MGKYYAVIKYTKNSRGHTTGEFDAKDHSEAFDKMLKLAQVQTSMSLSEYQLMHIVGRNYIVVGRKYADEQDETRIKSLKPRKPVGTHSVVAAPVVKATEVDVFGLRKKVQVTSL